MVFATPELSDEPTAFMSVPLQMLVGFTKVSILPGESVNVSITVPAKQLRLLGPDRKFSLVRGDYTLHVGGNGPGPTTALGSSEPLRTVLHIE